MSNEASLIFQHRFLVCSITIRKRPHAYSNFYCCCPKLIIKVFVGKQIIWSSKYKIHCVLTKTPLIRPEGTKKALMCLVIVVYYFEERKKYLLQPFLDLNCSRNCQIMMMGLFHNFQYYDVFAPNYSQSESMIY